MARHPRQERFVVPRKSFPGGICLAFFLLAGAQVVHAQSTDGYHTTQVFPVVVDTAAFAQRFNFRKLHPGITLVSPTFYPATGVTPTTPLACPEFSIPDPGIGFASLRALCPGLPAGSQFGFLQLVETSEENQPFAGFSRVSNPAGAGFTVEAFPAHTFTSASSAVNGLRRLAATPSSPSFQTNCFVGRINDSTPGSPTTAMSVFFGISDASNNPVGSTGFLSLAPGEIVRMLDVFAAVGAPAGNYEDAVIRFAPATAGGVGLVSFCTVQDNTSFGADFRISKQEWGGCIEVCTGDGAQDGHVNRRTLVQSDLRVPGEALPRAFAIPAGSNHQNTHLLFFRHPDRVQCEIQDPGTGQRAGGNYGLEMRLLDGATLAVIAGGNNQTGFGEVYLGDKDDRGDGANQRYLVQVESDELNTGSVRPYILHCQSGSGHTPGDSIRFNVPVDQF